MAHKTTKTKAKEKEVSFTRTLTFKVSEKFLKTTVWEMYYEEEGEILTQKQQDIVRNYSASLRPGYSASLRPSHYIDACEVLPLSTVVKVFNILVPQEVPTKITHTVHELFYHGELQEVYDLLTKKVIQELRELFEEEIAPLLLEQASEYEVEQQKREKEQEERRTQEERARRQRDADKYAAMLREMGYKVEAPTSLPAATKTAAAKTRK